MSIILFTASILLKALCGVRTTFSLSSNFLLATISLAAFSIGELKMFSSTNNSSPSITSKPAPDKVLIENWNNTATDFDTIFHLGDVALTNESEMKEIIPKLKGKKILIKGNHDKKSKEFFRSVGFEIIPDNPLKLDTERCNL